MQHLDEGTIHAWLDGALSPEEAARVERHATECRECAAVVAEARGLVAGASRIMSALDDVAAVVPIAGGGRRAEGGDLEMPSRLRDLDARTRRPPLSARRPVWLAAAAGLVLMAGSAVVLSKSGGMSSFDAPVADSAVLLRSRTTEAAAEAPSEGAAAGAADAAGPAGRDGARRDAASVGASAPSAVPSPGRASQRSAANEARRRGAESRAAMPLPPRVAASAQSGDTARRLNQELAAATPAAGAAVMQKEVGGKAKAVAPAAPPSQAPSEQALAIRGDATRRASRAAADQRMLADTVAVSRVDTTSVDDSLAPAGYRSAGRAEVAPRPFPVSGCYDVVEGGLPKPITLTTTRAWSGGAEQSFVVRARGATGYWSQPSSGRVHLMIARAVVTARIDPSTGELRGTVQRGGKSERFLARRGCR